MEQLEEDAEGWFQLGTVGQRLTNLSPEFDTRTFGHGKLSDLVEATGRFEINRDGPHVRLRPKRAPAQEVLTGGRGRRERGISGAGPGRAPSSSVSPALISHCAGARLEVEDLHHPVLGQHRVALRAARTCRAAGLL